MSVTSKLNSSSSPANKATITWVVDNFVTKTGCDWSPSFSYPNNGNIRFSLYLVFDSTIVGYLNKFITVYLYLRDFVTPKLPVRYRLSILDAMKQKRNEQVTQVSFDNLDVFTQRFQSYQIGRDHLLNPDNGLLVNGKVTFYCEVEIVEKDVFQINHDALLLKTSQDYEALLESGKCTDVVLKVGGQELMAHKLILMTRSPIFAAMFEHECKEKIENVVEITDVPVDVFKELLRFLYSGKTPNLEQFAPELLAAADKYQLDCLKSQCSLFLASKLDVESVAETLQLADLHQAAKLKSACLDYINDKRGVQVAATDGWKRLIANNLDLMIELFMDFSIKNQ